MNSIFTCTQIDIPQYLLPKFNSFIQNMFLLPILKHNTYWTNFYFKLICSELHKNNLILRLNSIYKFDGHSDWMIFSVNDFCSVIQKYTKLGSSKIPLKKVHGDIQNDNEER